LSPPKSPSRHSGLAAGPRRARQGLSFLTRIFGTEGGRRPARHLRIQQTSLANTENYRTGARRRAGPLQRSADSSAKEKHSRERVNPDGERERLTGLA
jgi:hypothetical protein